MAVWRTGGSPFEPHELEFLVGLSRRRRSRCRTRACSTRRRRRSSGRRPPPRCCRSSAARWPTRSRCSTRSSTAARGCSAPTTRPSAWSTATLLRIGAYRGKFTEEVEQAFPARSPARSATWRSGRGRSSYRPSVLAAQRHAGLHHAKSRRRRGDFSVVNAPMTWKGRGIGTIDIICTPPRPFSDAELALVKTFADQAVIAIQNARLFNETKEALERQTATADVLQGDQRIADRRAAGVRRHRRARQDAVRRQGQRGHAVRR